jgi:hypothetical protein
MYFLSANRSLDTYTLFKKIALQGRPFNEILSSPVRNESKIDDTRGRDKPINALTPLQR